MPQIRAAAEQDLAAWLTLRVRLWPEASPAEHRDELARLRAAPDRFCGFLAFAESGAAIGFAEASLRFEHVNGCGAAPVAFIEGVYVEPLQRRRGVARALCAAIEHWARTLGCSELGSDAAIDNVAGQQFHQAVGLIPIERVVFFRKELQ